MADTDRVRTVLSRTLHGVRKRVRASLIAGIALTLPLIVTLLVLKITLDFALRLFKPVGTAVNVIWPGQLGDPIAEAVAVVALLGVVVVLGFVTEIVPSERLIDGFHALIGSIPGIGTVYLSVRRMSDALFQGNAKVFHAVKLIEYPTEGVYSFGFVTGHAPGVIEEAAGNEEMQTLFMPFAPNPILSGRVVYVPTEQIYDVDMTVEEATHTLVTSGVVTQSRETLPNRSNERER